MDNLCTPSIIELPSFTQPLTELLSMINGKVSSVITGVGAQSCQICKVSPKGMNNLECHKIQGDPQSLVYGISVLHTNIRCMEHLCQVVYRLPIKKWQVQQKNKEDSEEIAKEKQEIQDAFNEKGLLIDIVLQGKGTTFDGNTARRFFRDPQMVSNFTGLDEQLVRRFAVLLGTINSGQRINSEKFKEYALDTAKLYVELYNWYYMPAHGHKFLLHGGDIINNLLLPLGQLSEEAAEASNKLIRTFRRDQTQKSSRENTMKDLLNMLLVNSDLYISTLRQTTIHKKEPLFEDILQLIVQEPLVMSAPEISNDDDDEVDLVREQEDFFNLNINEDLLEEMSDSE